MFTLLLILYVISCLILILVILLQSGKSADLAGAFGLTSSQTAFGPRGGATLLSRITTVAAILFMVIALVLAFLWRDLAGGSSVLDKMPEAKSKTEQPAAPAKPAQTPVQQPAPAAATPAAQGATQTPAAGQSGVKVEGPGSESVAGVQTRTLSQAEYDAMVKEAQQKKKDQPKPPAEGQKK